MLLKAGVGMLKLIFLNTICQIYILTSKIRIFLMKYTGIKIGKGTSIRGKCYFDSVNIRIGDNCSINHSCQFNLGKSKLTIGNNVYVTMNVNFCGVSHEIGNHKQRAGDNTYKDICIEDGVWIGTDVVLLQGITIKKGTIIAAGSVVTKDISENVIVGGNPAKILGYLSPTADISKKI